MGWALTVYIAILLLDLFLGCSLIIWKCTDSEAKFECQLSVSGTIASVAVWLLVILVCPCFMSRCEICFLVDSIITKCARFWEKLDPRNSDTVYIPNEIYFPTTVSLLENGQDDIMQNKEDTSHLIKVSDRNDVKDQLICNYSVLNM